MSIEETWLNRLHKQADMWATDFPEMVSNKDADSLTLNDIENALESTRAKIQDAIKLLLYVNNNYNVIDGEKMTQTLLAMGEFNTVLYERLHK